MFSVIYSKINVKISIIHIYDNNLHSRRWAFSTRVCAQMALKWNSSTRMCTQMALIREVLQTTSSKLTIDHNTSIVNRVFPSSSSIESIKFLLIIQHHKLGSEQKLVLKISARVSWVRVQPRPDPADPWWLTPAAGLTQPREGYHVIPFLKI